MSPARPRPVLIRERDAPIALHERALDDLQFIRQTMASTVSYTAFSGWGLLLVGAGALLTGVMARHAATPSVWTRAWVVDAVISVVIGVASGLLKTQLSQQPLVAGPVRKFALGFVPTIFAAAVLTAALIASSNQSLLAGTWLLLYGAAIAAAGTASVAAIPLMGSSFFVLGVITLAAPHGWGNSLMMAGFAGLHLLFGGYIAWRHGG